MELTHAQARVLYEAICHLRNRPPTMTIRCPGSGTSNLLTALMSRPDVFSQEDVRYAVMQGATHCQETGNKVMSEKLKNEFSTFLQLGIHAA